VKIIDISWPVSPTVTEYKDRRTVAFTHTKIFEKDGVRESVISMNVHTGTHVDAPAHFLLHGATIDATPLMSLVGPCVVLNCTDVKDAITAEHLERYADLCSSGDIVLLKTTNSDEPVAGSFNKNFVFLAASGAQFLADLEVKAVGIDYLGIERGQADHATHEILLLREIPIIEGLRLGSVQAGNYHACIAPLLLQGLEAAPARAFLIQE
jgi:arylformamidase